METKKWTDEKRFDSERCSLDWTGRKLLFMGTLPARTCLKLTIEALEQGVESHLILVFLFLTFNR